VSKLHTELNRVSFVICSLSFLLPLPILVREFMEYSVAAAAPRDALFSLLKE
jgi:hypothetical protein